jgi:23S rRNA (uracil1939-C5)-methyltransferase
MPRVGELIELRVEKPATGGRMLARHEGQVVLVSGAIPGERVTARLERAQRDVLFAATAEVLEPHAGRRPALPDPGCGGTSYSHITIPLQQQLKVAVVAEAFARIARLAVPPPAVTGSPEHGYRLRARLHLRNGRIGSFRQGTHDLCDYRQTRQLRDDTCDALEWAGAALAARGIAEVEAIEVMENLPATERVVHVDLGRAAAHPGVVLTALSGAPGLTGVSLGGRTPGRPLAETGRPFVSDALDAVVTPPGGAPPGAELRRHAPAFFQANRFLVGTLARRVSDLASPGTLVDLYAGVGLFSVTAAALGQQAVVAVEGDPASGSDLRHNAAAFAGTLRVERTPVEAWLGSGRAVTPSTLVVDPPRTGMSREAMKGVIDLRAPRVIYVSCDVATLARDASRLHAAGYGLTNLEALDLFPNTPHVECIAVFDLGG